MDMLAKAAIGRAQAALQLAVGGDSGRELARAYARTIIARAASPDDPHAFALKRWGADARATTIIKAGVEGSDSADMLLANDARDAHFRSVIERTVVGRMDQARRVGFNTRCITPNANSAGYWVGESKPIPLSQITLTGDTLTEKKAAALAIFTKESLRDPALEEVVLQDLERALVLAVDQAFVDAGNSGSDATPAAVTAAATPITSSGDPAADLGELVADFEGDFDAAVAVTDPTTAVQAAMARDAAGAFLFPNLGPRGGFVAGLPVLTSRASPRDSSGGQIALIDQGAVAVALDALEVTRSNTASVSASDDPENESIMLHLFQAELVAIKAVLRGNWQLVRAGASVVAGADYGAS